MRVLVANEPRSYRETIAAALRYLRPELDVALAEPYEIDVQIASFSPDMVICSRLTPAVQGVMSWVVLYPEGKARSEISVAGERSTGDDLEFESLLSVVDRTERLLVPPTSAANGAR